jgi:hypothetical protein
VALVEIGLRMCDIVVVSLDLYDDDDRIGFCPVRGARL